MTAGASLDVLVVGAGPTGLALAAQLRRCGARFRIVDRLGDRARETRAVAVQPRTLEVLADIGVADTMVERGNPGIRLQMHSGTRTARVPLFDIGLEDTAYPFLLFLSQAETEAILDDHLGEHGVDVERGVELVGLRQDPESVTCALRHGDSRREEVSASYVVGCDGVRSSVRSLAGIEFVGSAYPQTFVLADLDAEGLDPGVVHVHLSAAGMLFFFPLGRPAPWRLLGMLPTAGQEGLPDLQALADTYTGGRVRLGATVWATTFRLQQRRAARYRAGRVALAGDAAHVHSPAGAQGMNTGIQDAWNLGWKLALAADARAAPDLLDTYQAEREPVGREVLRFTDRAFRVATSRNRLVGLLRTRVAPRLLQIALGSRRGRALGFRAISQLAVNYRRSPAVHDDRPRPRRGPRPGDRLPDAPVTVDGQPQTLHRAVGSARFHLLVTSLDAQPAIEDDFGGLVELHRLTRQAWPGSLVDLDGQAHQRLGLDPTTGGHILVRPDGHIAHRANGTSLEGLRLYMARWLPDTREASR